MGNENSSRLAGSRMLLTGASVVVVIAGLKAAQTLLIPFLIAMFLAILCAPPVFWLQRRRVPTVVAVLIVVIVIFAVMVGFGAVISGSIKEFTASMPQYQERLNQMALSTSLWAEDLDLPFTVPDLKLQEMINLGAIMGLITNGLKGILNVLSNTVLVVLTLVFMLLEATGMPFKLRAAMGSSDADLSRFSKVTSEVQQYLAIKTLLSLVTGAIIAIWLGFVGLDFALVWGLLAFLLNYIPTLGSIIAAVPAVMLAIVQLGPGPALLVLLGFVVVNVSIGNLLEPHLMGRTLGLSTLVVFLSLVFWGWVWGPVGMLLSVPLTMIVKILLENSDDLKWLGVILDSGAAAAARLDGATDTPMDAENGGAEDGRQNS